MVREIRIGNPKSARRRGPLYTEVSPKVSAIQNVLRVIISA